MNTPVPANPRPRVVDIAFWLLVLGAVLLVLAGLLTATISLGAVRPRFPESVSDEQLRDYLMFFRGVGVVCALAGAGLGFTAGRMRRGDPRFRRAAVALAAVIVVLVCLVAVFAGIYVLAIVALLPILVGAVLLTRPAATTWFDGGQA